jgi:hypothetical protein
MSGRCDIKRTFLPPMSLLCRIERHEEDMNHTSHPERERLQALEDQLEGWKRRILDGLDDSDDGVDPAFTARFEETSRRLLGLNGKLHDADWDPEALAEIRGIILDGLAALDSTDPDRPLDTVDDFLVRMEAIRHLVRDALDAHVPGDGGDARELMAQLDEWLPGIKRTELARLLDRTPRHLQRWAKEGGRATRRLQLVTRLVALLRRGWTPEGIVAWFYRPRRDLDSKAPIDIIDDPDYERDLVVSVRQGRAQHGT